MIIAQRNLVFIFVLMVLQGAALVIWYHRYATVSHSTPKPSNRKVHVLLLSSWRSGSSFTGQLFNLHPDVFYLFAPDIHVWKSMRTEKAWTLRMALRDELRSLLHCDFSVMESYLPKNPKVSSLFRFSDVRALCSQPGCPQMPPDQAGNWKVCEKLCRKASLSHVEKICNNHSHVVLKVVRVLDLESLFPLFKDSHLNFRIIHLIRDPQAVELSREGAVRGLAVDAKVLLGQADILANAQVWAMKEICSSHVRIMEKVLLNPPPFLKGRYKMVRYEDMVRNPLDEINSMYEFVGLRMTQQLAQWAYNSMRGDEKARGGYQPGSRDAIKISEAWRTKMSYSKVQRVQEECKEAMELLGYKPVSSVEEQKNLNSDLLLPVKLHYFKNLEWEKNHEYVVLKPESVPEDPRRGQQQHTWDDGNSKTMI